MIAVIDYGIGNVGSVMNMLRRLNIKSITTEQEYDPKKVSRYILPGVGSFDAGITALKNYRHFHAIENDVLNNHKPIFGICLGMQLLFDFSEEGKLPGLGWISGKVVRFNLLNHLNLRVPHMGWNNVDSKDKSLYKGFDKDKKFYFVHSYYVVPKFDEDILAFTTYGIKFVCSVQHKNIYGCQFHPEKSHKYGMKLLQNYAMV